MRPKGVVTFYYVVPFVAGESGAGREAVIEEGFYGCFFGRGGVFGDEADETTFVWFSVLVCSSGWEKEGCDDLGQEDLEPV